MQTLGPVIISTWANATTQSANSSMYALYVEVIIQQSHANQNLQDQPWRTLRIQDLVLGQRLDKEEEDTTNGNLGFLFVNSEHFQRLQLSES